jgi:hypothetical protein
VSRFYVFNAAKWGILTSMNKLKESSLSWAIKHLVIQGDSDLFPHAFEYECIKSQSASLLRELESVDITSYQWQGVRQMLVPKDEYLFRNAMQLDPIDNIIFAAIIKEVGKKIENRRLDTTAVFSYRFSPTKDGQFYGEKNLWEEFWRNSIQKAQQFEYVAVTDISDFYNQIYHHTIENQLIASGIEKYYRTALLNLLKETTQGISRGIPIGPFASHMLAELDLIPIDEVLKLRGYEFCRYVDDIHIFCKSREDAQIAIYELADGLNDQKLILNKQKTEILNKHDFTERATLHLVNNPINAEEREIIDMVKRNTGGPYNKISHDILGPEDLGVVSRLNVEAVLKDHLTGKDVDYARLRWFLRRLSQIETPEGIEFLLENIKSFIPAIADTANYIYSAQKNYKGDWGSLGTKLISILEFPVVKSNGYLQAIVLSLFSNITSLDHIETLIKKFDSSGAVAKRKIVLAAIAANAGPWLGSLKKHYSTMDPWLKRAVLYGAKRLPSDEKKYWLKLIKPHASILENVIIRAIS